MSSLNDTSKAAIQALGWMLAEACTLMDKGEDVRTKNASELIDRMKKDLSCHPEPLVFQDSE